MTDKTFTKNCFTVELVQCGGIYQVKFVITPAFSTLGDYEKYFRFLAKVFWKGHIQITRNDYESMCDFLQKQPRQTPLDFFPSFSQLCMKQENLVKAKAKCLLIDSRERLAHQFNSLGFVLDPVPSEIDVDFNEPVYSIGENVLALMSNYFFEKRQRLANALPCEHDNVANKMFEELCNLLQ